ncbi:MAG: T9SS type A sorting domain-containing protein [Fibromonadaceae bacterium]|nr:T9SS type A sorting domain-containing protein [Fibromonadaceae bacterium]
MRKLKILAVAGLASAAFSAGNLWDFATLLDATNCGTFCGQVHTPGAVYCWSQVTPSATNGWGRPCFDGTGGWWFGYADEGGTVKDASSSNNVFVPKGQGGCETDLKPTEAIGTIVIEKYIEPGKQNVDWIEKTVAGATTGTAGKHYLVKGYGLGAGTDGLDVTFSNPGGTDEKPSVSAIGFNWRGKEECERTDYEGSYIENIGGAGAGLCIVYKADKAGVDVELGWNESLYEYNTWIAKLPAASSWKTVNIKWESFGLSYETGEPTEPRETALTKAEALKFALKTKTAAAETIHFQLKEVGWHGSCSGDAEELPPYQGGGGDPSPIVGGKVASAYNFNLNGRTLSANFAGTVQVVSLQGKVVAQKTLAKDERLNLSNLPVGVYMVRSESRGIVQKIMLK